MNIKPYKYLFFDLDGTLNKSGEGIMRCAQHTLRHFGIEIEDLNTLLPFVGPPLEDSFRDLYHLDNTQVEEALDIYAQRYAQLGAYEAELYPGILNLLDELRKSGKTIIIATSKKITMTLKVTKHFGLDQYVDFIGARDDEGKRHTKADVIRYIIDQMQIKDLKDCVMIGDRKYDMIGAEETGMDAIGVLYGYGDREELEAHHATYIAEDIAELKKLLIEA